MSLIKDKYITAENQIRLQKLILKVARETFPDFSTGGCTPFYTSEAWAARGEDYGTKSKLVVVYDGGELRPFFSLDEGYTLYEKMRKALDEAGYWVEQCTGWYSAIYKK